MSLDNLWCCSVSENCLDICKGFSSSGDKEEEEREKPAEERRVGFDKLSILLLSPLNRL